VDATLGLAGHARAIIDRLGPNGQLLGVDADPEALSYARDHLSTSSRTFRTVQGNFRTLDSILVSEKFTPICGALFDIGVSSLQLDKPNRGFSFRHSGPLDMRMSPDTTLTAEMIVNRWPAEQIALILSEFGEEDSSERIARAIVTARSKKNISSTSELAAIVESVIPRTGHHPATRTFQALRIAVNQELDALTLGLQGIVKHIAPGGRLCVITFHSLEDRITKNYFSELVSQHSWEYVDHQQQPVSASDEEILKNPRSRSAKLRVIQKKVKGATSHEK
jgi:16S rRNA (cytosine1402-N4)-methyltransferase